MSGDSLKSHMPPCSSEAPGHDINGMWAWKVACRYIREHPEECVPVRVEDVGDGWFDVIFDGWTRKAWNHDPDRVANIAGRTVALHCPKYDIIGAFGHTSGDDGPVGSTLQVIRPAWGGGAPCPRGLVDPEVRPRDYGHARSVTRG